MSSEVARSISSSTVQAAIHQPELLAPAGNWDCAKAAVENGADAIYFGLDQFNARMRADNFTTADLPVLMAYLHQRGVKGYVTLNTLIFTHELAAVECYLKEMIQVGVDAVIVQDVGLCRLIRHLSPDFPIHASTQMTITSAIGVKFAKSLGCQLVVLARECSLKEICKIQQQIAEAGATLPLEVFVHGALCVAYSGQCLTSESLGGRSANRGECAQACRMTYDLIADGQLIDLGDRKYLLSPQDLAGLEVLPELVQAGITCLKIEGRLKTPEYVANVTQVYRQALDRLRTHALAAVTSEERYRLEMAFSRGLYTGWFQGIDNQALVHARFGKKRGAYLGQVTQIKGQTVTVRLEAAIKAGDGIVFDSGQPDREEGGRVYGVQQRGQDAILQFGKHDLDWRRIRVGDRVWKTSDPELDRHLRQTYTSETPQYQHPLHAEVQGAIGTPLTLVLQDELGHLVRVDSTCPLVAAHTQPLTTERLQEQLGRLGNTPFFLSTLNNQLVGPVMLPVSALNRLRREAVDQLLAARSQSPHWHLNPTNTYTDLLPTPTSPPISPSPSSSPHLIALVRNLSQLQATLEADITTIYCEFEDPRLSKAAVQQVAKFREVRGTAPTLWVVPPRITKPRETWILQQVRDSGADGYLVRNYDHLQFFAHDRCIGDFSLNVANPLSADYFKQQGLERLTASYDLNIDQLTALITACPRDWFEVTVHQHMPMFHMEHCVFCAFLSDGTDYTNCGRPCEQYEVKLRDRTGSEHLLRADAGCRNTVFNGTPQTAAEYIQQLIDLGVRHFRLEFVNESAEKVTQTIRSYQQLLCGELTGQQLWRRLRLQNQLGVTRGTLV